MKSCKLVCYFLWGLGFGSNTLQANDIYVPDTVAEGNSALSIIGQLPTHIQQVYAASEFQVLPVGGANLMALCFRTDSPLGFGFFATVTNLQITVSTTTRGPDQLSTIFANNLGSDASVVLATSMYPFHAGGGAINGMPNVLDGCFVFSTPFRYGPAMGNLLIDIQTFSNNGSTISPFDAVSILGDSVSSVTSYNGNLNVGQADTRGLVTDLFFVPVPEPSSIVLAILGSTTAVLWTFRGHRGRKKQAAK